MRPRVYIGGTSSCCPSGSRKRRSTASIPERTYWSLRPIFTIAEKPRKAFASHAGKRRAAARQEQADYSSASRRKLRTAARTNSCRVKAEATDATLGGGSGRRPKYLLPPEGGSYGVKAEATA